MNHGSLFSGIGGFDLAAEWMGWNNVFHCEWNEFGQKVLKYYWPNAISYGDITKTDFTVHRGRIDVLTGGFPCQPFSFAGKRKGTTDDRYLWPEMLRCIRDVQPGWIVAENVSGIVNMDGGMVFEQVQSDLEAAGYEIIPFILPACGVNAPHRRDRVWFVAHTKDLRSTIGKLGEPKSGFKIQARGDFNGYADMGITPDTSDKGLQGCEINRSIRGIREVGKQQSQRLFQSTWEVFPTQSPLCSRNDGLSSQLSGITFSKHRNESIKAYGNAIVPQAAYQIFKAIQQYED